MEQISVEIREATALDDAGLRIVSHEAHATLRLTYVRTPKEKKGTSSVPFTRWVAIHDGKVVGTLTHEAQGGSLYFGSLGVLTSCRRKGIAKQLISFLEQFAKRTGFGSLSCETILETGNVDFFNAMGFRCCSQIESKEFESPSGAVVNEVFMEKKV